MSTLLVFLFFFIYSKSFAQEFEIINLEYVENVSIKDSTIIQIIFILEVSDPEEIDAMLLSFGYQDMEADFCNRFKRIYESRDRIRDIRKSNNNDGTIINVSEGLSVPCADRKIYFSINTSRAKIKKINFYNVTIQYRSGNKAHEPIKTAYFSVDNFDGTTSDNEKYW
ncbi:MAG: hypothetical protein ACK5P1_09465 [Sphingobacteriia bacterium]